VPQVLRVHAGLLVSQAQQVFEVPAALALLAQPALQGLRELVAQLAFKAQAALALPVQPASTVRQVLRERKELAAVPA
jgi:hypothetical protein